VTDEGKKALSDAVKKRWQERREELSRRMRHAKSTGIEISETEDYASYQREYQRIYREKHPDYYKNLKSHKQTQ